MRETFYSEKSKEENFELEKSEIRENAEEIEKFMGVMAGELRREGFPIGNDGRINMQAFEEVYSPKSVERDEKDVKNAEKQFYKGLSKEEIEEKKLMSTGERFERLKTAVMYKAFGEKFIIARSSRYDDINNGIDNVIVEKETGNVVCAVDDVATNENSEKFEEKKAKVMKKNRKDGGMLKYGITINKNNGEALKIKTIKNLPLFHLALSKDALEESEKNFIPSLEEKSSYEEDLASAFLSSIKAQIDLLKLEPKLNANLERRIDLYEKALEKLEKI